MLDHLWCRIDG